MPPACRLVNLCSVLHSIQRRLKAILIQVIQAILFEQHDQQVGLANKQPKSTLLGRLVYDL